jgi:integrase
MSKRKPFTDIAIRNLRPGPTRREIPDPGARGLYLVLQPSGTRGFCVRYRHGGRPRKLTLQPGVSLAGARKLCADAMLQVAQGIDPGEARDRAASTAANTLKAIAETYMKIEGPRLRSRRDRQSILERLIYPKLGHRSIGEIERDEIVVVLDKIADTSGPRMSDMALAVLSRIFNWHETRTSRFRSPLARGMARLRPMERMRQRLLSDDEIRRIWHACEAMGIFGQYVRFLLLSAARRTEASAMEWAELADGVWTLPSQRHKAKTDCIRPLSADALAILNRLPRIVGSKYIFTADGRRALRADAKRKRKLDELSGVSNWVFHDTRRVARSLLARARVPSDVAEMCLGHSPPGLVRQTYDLHSYSSEMSEAFEALAVQLRAIISAPTTTVTKLAARR